MLKQFTNKLDHIYTAYKYSLSAIPQDSLFVNGNKVTIGEFIFEKPSQAHSIEVELGWAFFCSMEACFEVFLMNKLGKDKIDEDKLSKLELWNELTSHEQEGIKIYREIRNAIHHSEGHASLLKKKPQNLYLEKDTELRLLPAQMDEFRNLFIKVAKLLEKAAAAPLETS